MYIIQLLLKTITAWKSSSEDEIFRLLRPSRCVNVPVEPQLQQFVQREREAYVPGQILLQLGVPDLIVDPRVDPVSLPVEDVLVPFHCPGVSRLVSRSEGLLDFHVPRDHLHSHAPPRGHIVAPPNEEFGDHRRRLEHAEAPERPGDHPIAHVVASRRVDDEPEHEDGLEEMLPHHVLPLVEFGGNIIKPPSPWIDSLVFFVVRSIDV